MWCDVSRDVLTIAGADALTFLQSQISQDIRTLADEESVYSFVLQPTGKIESLVRVHRISAEQFVLDTDAGYGPATMARLNRFKIRVKVEIVAVPWRCIAVRSCDAPVAGGIPAWGLDDAWDLLGPDASVPIAVRIGTQEEFDLARIEAGWPAMGREITDATIPAETGHVVARAVSFTKGCYPGQELVERMDSRGSAAPRFVRRLRGSGMVAVGDSVESGDKSVGTITSVQRVADTGWVALAIIARSIQPGVVVTVGGAESSVEDLATR